MSRRSLERRRLAEDRWPTLLKLFELDGAAHGLGGNAIATLPIEDVGTLLEEWSDWNSGYGWKTDAGAVLSDGFGIDHDPADANGARRLMGVVYDAAIQRWRAAGKGLQALTIGRLNHVGVATSSIERSVALYRDLLGATAIGVPFDLPAQGVRVCFVDLPNTQIELIEPLGEGSPIHGFLQKNPAGGQHHLCFEVPDVRAAAAEMVAKGARVLGEPRIGAHGTLVQFVHPRDMGGVLVELMETPGDH